MKKSMVKKIVFLLLLVTLFVAGTSLVGGQSAEHGDLFACVKGGSIRMVSTIAECKENEAFISWYSGTEVERFLVGLGTALQDNITAEAMARSEADEALLVNIQDLETRIEVLEQQ